MNPAPMTLTLGEIRAHRPCKDGWAKLIDYLGTSNPDTVIGLGDVLQSNGRADALWCLQALPPRERVRLIMPAVKRASAHTTDLRVHDCIAAIDKWLAGDDLVDLRAAEEAAWEAARAAEAEVVWAAAAEVVWAARAAMATEADEIPTQADDIMRLSPPRFGKGGAA